MKLGNDMVIDDVNANLAAEKSGYFHYMITKQGKYRYLLTCDSSSSHKSKTASFRWTNLAFEN